MSQQDLPGEPTDRVPAVLATGNGGISTVFVSMSQRHPGGDDAGYLRWHTLDHRPEQQRLAGIRTSIRVVSTPACREARAVNDIALDAVDHLMLYFFADESALGGFSDLGTALHEAGRSPFILPAVERGVYGVRERHAAPRVRIGADVLPWLPVKGLYILVSRSGVPVRELTGIAGVAGAWSATSIASPYASAATGQQMTLCFLDDDPVATAGRLASWVDGKAEDTGLVLAAPYHAVVPYEWTRYLP